MWKKIAMPAKFASARVEGQEKRFLVEKEKNIENGGNFRWKNPI